MSENIVKYPQSENKNRKMKSRFFFDCSEQNHFRPSRSSLKDLVGCVQEWCRREAKIYCFYEKLSKALRRNYLLNLFLSTWLSNDHFHNSQRAFVWREGWNGRRRSGADEIILRYEKSNLFLWWYYICKFRHIFCDMWMNMFQCFKINLCSNI